MGVDWHWQLCCAQGASGPFMMVVKECWSRQLGTRQLGDGRDWWQSAMPRMADDAARVRDSDATLPRAQAKEAEDGDMAGRTQ